MTLWKLWTVSIGIGIISFAGLMYWYEWSARALSSGEIDAYVATIEAQTQSPGGRHDITALRHLLERDDGRPIYTVNLYKFRERADYPAGSGFTGTGEDAYQRFSKTMISLLAKRASHPIYGSNWVDASSDWDRVVIVRYRSRRDLVDLFATDAFADAAMHKWASLREHQRMVVQATHIPDGRNIFLIVASILTGGCLLVLHFVVRV